MTSKYFFTLALIGGGATLTALTGVGCGGGGTGGGTTTTSTTKSTTTHPTTTSGSGGSTSAGNHDITMSTPVTIDGAATVATLVDAATSDFYTFNGKAGDRIVIGAFATQLQTAGKGFDATVTDLTFVLTGSDMNVMTPLSYNDDGWPDFSQDAIGYFQLPADGAYYIGVQDCNTLFSSGCPYPASGITSFDYQLVVAHTSKLTNPELLATGQDGTTAKAQKVTYVVPKGGKAGSYSSTIIGGALATATDTQVFSFTPPTDTTLTAGSRARAEFYVQPIGSFQGGDLSDANIKIWVTDSTGNVILSQADQNNFLTNKTTYSLLEFSAPVTLGTQYYLFVQNTMTGGSAAKDFYFIDHYLNPLINVAEKEKADKTGPANDTSATAEALTAQGSSKHFFTVDGDITTPADVDWYSFTVPTGVTQFQIQCDSARSGSGLGGFKVEMFAADGTTSIASATETATADLLTPAANVPAASIGKQVFLKMTGATQSATVKGTQYRCYAFFG
jgi:hypothetical protein